MSYVLEHVLSGDNVYNFHYFDYFITIISILFIHFLFCLRASKKIILFKFQFKSHYEQAIRDALRYQSCGLRLRIIECQIQITRHKPNGCFRSEMGWE